MTRIKLSGVWKKFIIEHEDVSSLKEKFVASLQGGTKQKKKGDLWAIKDVSFEAKEGECIGIIGENGSGKTTLLKVIAGILKPTQGKVEVDGKIVALLTLGLGFNPELTAKDNVYLYGSIMGLAKEEIDLKYENIVNFSELRDFMDVKLKNFSDGMKVRLGFATAINIDADILLVDEVMAVGDMAFQKKCLDKLKELKEMKKLIILVSHSMDIIKQYCDKAILLCEGEARVIGKPEEVIGCYEIYLKNKEMKVYNSEVLRNIVSLGIIEDMKVYGLGGEKCWVFRNDEPFKAEVRLNSDERLSELFLSFFGQTEVRLFSKKKRDNLFEFSINSIPLREGEYELAIDELMEGSKRFKIIIWAENRGAELAKIFSKDLSLDGEILVFGRNCERIFEEFENGATLIVFSNLEDAAKGSEEGAIFNGRKLILKGKNEEVIRKYEEVTYKRLLKKYGAKLGLE